MKAKLFLTALFALLSFGALAADVGEKDHTDCPLVNSDYSSLKGQDGVVKDLSGDASAVRQ